MIETMTPRNKINYFLDLNDEKKIDYIYSFFSDVGIYEEKPAVKLNSFVNNSIYNSIYTEVNKWTHTVGVTLPQNFPYFMKNIFNYLQVLADNIENEVSQNDLYTLAVCCEQFFDSFGFSGVVKNKACSFFLGKILYLKCRRASVDFKHYFSVSFKVWSKQGITRIVDLDEISFFIKVGKELYKSLKEKKFDTEKTYLGVISFIDYNQSDSFKDIVYKYSKQREQKLFKERERVLNLYETLQELWCEFNTISMSALIPDLLDAYYVPVNLAAVEDLKAIRGIKIFKLTIGKKLETTFEEV